MRILLALAAVLLPSLAGASGPTSGPCPPSTYGPKRALDCLLDARGSLRAVLYESTDGATQEIAVHEPGIPPRTLISGRAYSFRDVSPMLMAQLGGPGALEPEPTPLPMNPPRPAPESVSLGDSRVIERTYDQLDRLETETVPLENGGTATVRYSYYNDGRRRTTTDAFGRVAFYEYDGRGNLERVTTNQGLPDEHVTSYAYWPDNLLRSITRPNGTITSYDYDRADRLRSVTVRRGVDVLLSHEYTYDANGNRLTQVETNGGAPETTTYTYDALNRLETVTYPGGASVTYEYDAVGNRTRETERDASGVIVSDKTAVFDPINRLSSITDAVNPANDATLTYDRNGNLRTKTTAAGTEEYDYDTRDLLVETRSGTTITGRYAYDAFGRRYLKYGLEGIRQYLYDETSTLHELGETGLEVAKYEYGGSSLLSVTRSDEARRFHHQDALGSVVGLSDEAGQVVARYHLDAWGRYLAPAELDASRNRFGFTGYLWDRETNLYYAKARFYDPELGRFISQDSALGTAEKPPSLHRYLYAHANPTRYIDPTGHGIEFVAGPELEMEQNRVFREAAVRAHGLARGNQEAEQYEAFKRGLAEERILGALDAATFGFSAGVRNGFEAGRIQRGEINAWQAGAEGMFLRLPGAAAGFGAAVDGQGLGATAGAVVGDLVGYTDLVNAADSRMDPYDRLRSGISGTLKLAGLVTGLRGALGRGRAAAAEAPTGRVVESTAASTTTLEVSKTAALDPPATAPAAPVPAVPAAQELSLVPYDASFARNQQGILGRTHTISTSRMTSAEAAATREYADRVNAFIEQSGTPLMRVPTKGALRRAASATARAERLRAARAGTPYQGRAGHVPDTAWTGQPQPPAGWLDMPGFSNDAVGGFVGGVKPGTVGNYIKVE